MNKVRSNVYLTPALKEALADRAAQEGCSASNLITRAVTQYLAKVKS